MTTYAQPQRTNTSRTVDREGNTTEQWVGEEQPGIRTHDYEDEDAINERLFGKGAVKRTQTTKTSFDKDGNKTTEWDGEAAPGIRTHDHSDQNAENAKLFGKTSRSNTSKYTDKEGNEVESYSGEGTGPGIRTHDYSNEDDINEKLFGSSAPKPPSRTNTKTRTYRNADGDEETVHAGDEAPGIRTHDHSNEDEINEKLFGKGAVKH
ncbi:hypothetical protein BGX38DRAFT_1223226 [Terfezia claveryi]|nr:hypothetical protein BGX38DRAFT_1223226 [Terfezia claveryi]